MTSGTKVLLAVIGLFVGVLIAYYGFFLSPDAPPTAGMSDPAMETPADGDRLAGARSAGAGGDRTEPARTAQPRRTPSRNAVTMGEPGAVRNSGADDRTVVPLARPTTARRPPVAGTLPPVPLRTRSASDRDADGGPDGTAPVPARRTAADPTVDRRTARGPAANRPATTTPVRTGAARPAPPRYTEYRVRAGDTMSDIAESWFGSETHWDLIARANPRVDPMKLRIGQVLRLPPRDTARKASEVPVPPDADEHVVRAGETLSSIAARYLGSANEWRRIFEANRRLLGSDPDRLEVGMRLRIP